MTSNRRAPKMTRIPRGPRPVIFVCIASKDNKIISKVIKAASEKEAASFFTELTGSIAEIIHGPFRPKRMAIDNNRELKFSSKSIRAKYNDWEVNAMFLNEPKDHAFLIFIKRIDGKSSPAPKVNVVIPTSLLELL